MMRIQPEIDSASVVLLGKFNPSIFTPAWFGWNGLLPESVVSNAVSQITHPQISVFDADWLRLEVQIDKFILSAAQPFFINLCDLAVRIFREKLPHTPLTAIGINRDLHYRVRNFGERMKLGRKLAPIEPWGDWGNEIEHNEIASGMTSLTMTQVNPKGRSPDCKINVTVQPSNRITDDSVGVYIGVNDHYEIANQNSQTASSDIVNLLESNFDESIKHSNDIINQIMSLTEN